MLDTAGSPNRSYAESVLIEQIHEKRPPFLCDFSKCQRHLHPFELVYLSHLDMIIWASLVDQTVKICLQRRRPGFHPWVGKIPWRRAWQHTPVFLPGEFYGQRSLAGYSPWGHKESDTTVHIL